ncbi:MAG TPA: hypothetical protein VNH18_32460 [Bryobacteraceae bacterium]|nr:hypothetical protein [Bryobacteraceae bacterium]
MESEPSQLNVQELVSWVRDFIQHPRRLGPLIENEPEWNVLTSAMDLISDTEEAIESYLANKDEAVGCRYLVLYGALQAMYMQEDALEGLVRVLTGDDKYKIEQEPEAARIRQVRHDAVGHPTKQGGINIKRNGEPNEQVSHAIVRHSMETARFEVIRSSNLSGPRIDKIDMLQLIDANRELATRVLSRVKTRLEELEMAHREEFKSEKLRAIFHSSMGYSFQKIFGAIDSPDAGNTVLGPICLKEVITYFNNFKEALQRRGCLPVGNHLDMYLDEAEYALNELVGYFSNNGFLAHQPRAAEVFTFYAKHKMEELEAIAGQIDDEYEEEVSARAGE